MVVAANLMIASVSEAALVTAWPIRSILRNCATRGDVASSSAAPSTNPARPGAFRDHAQRGRIEPREDRQRRQQPGDLFGRQRARVCF
jgi:hypothetical protein